MIAEWVLGAGAGLLHALLSLVPDVTVPSWLAGSNSAFAAVFGAAGSMGVWFPAPLLVTVLGAVLALLVVGFGLKVARMVLSLFTAGGGSAA